MAGGPENSVEQDQGPAIPPRRLVDQAEMDMTPMIDCTFLLLVFFTVTSMPDTQIALDLAPARHGVGVSRQDSTIVSLAGSGGSAPAAIYLADGKIGEPLGGTPAEQDAQIREAIEAGKAAGRGTLIIMAEKGVLHRDVARVAKAAALVEDIKLHLGVMEID